MQDVQDGSFSLGDFALENGGVIPDAKIVYRTFGRMSDDRSNVIVYPTSFGTTHSDLQWLVGDRWALDPRRYFIVMVNLFGSGLSSSPSHSGHRPDRASFPLVTMRDNVAAQQRLLREHLGARRIELVVGFSMGAQATYHWALDAPDLVTRAAVICGSARTARHNYVFLEGVKAALKSDPSWHDGYFREQPERGLRCMGRVYAGWGLSQAFYRDELYKPLGHASLEDFIVDDWEARFVQRDGDDLLSMLLTWQGSDISNNDIHKGDLKAALGSIRPRMLLMPSSSDLYFPPQDSLEESLHIDRVELCPIDTKWGHRINNPQQNPVDARFISNKLTDFLES